MGSTNKAYKQARRDEEARQAEIKKAQARVNQIFSDPKRQEDYLRAEDATRSLLTSDLDRQKTDADLQTKFALARAGLSHGSVDFDKHRRLAEDYLRGIVEVERRSRSAGADLMTQDRQAKSSLFSQILGGLDATTAGQEAARHMQQSIAQNASNDYAAGFNNMFGNMADFWKSSKTAAGDRRAAYDFNSLYGQRGNQGYGIAGGVYG